MKIQVATVWGKWRKTCYFHGLGIPLKSVKLTFGLLLQSSWDLASYSVKRKGIVLIPSGGNPYSAFYSAFCLLCSM